MKNVLVQSLFLICFKSVPYWIMFRENLSTKTISKHFSALFSVLPLNTEMSVNVSGHFIRDGAARLREGSLWSAVKSENQLVGFSLVLLDETPQHRRLKANLVHYSLVFKILIEMTMKNRKTNTTDGYSINTYFY